MELKREHHIAAGQSTVWDALNDLEVLKASIPGCQSLERLDENSLRATIKIKVGPVAATFSGLLRTSELDPPNGYRMEFEGQGGAAGFARGHARVDLRAQGDEATLLTYEAQAQVGGRLAQIGSRLIDSVAVKTSSAFFDSFSKVVVARRQAAVP